MARIENLGGAIAAVEASYMKEQLVASATARFQAIESGAQTVVGVNRFVESEPSPLLAGADGGIMTVDPASEQATVEALLAWRAQRDGGAAQAAVAELKSAAAEGRNIMEPSIACAHAGVTTGEWGDALRQVFGEYRAPTGVAKAAARPEAGESLESLRARVAEVSERLGRRIKMLVGKPGLDGHSNGAEQIAVRARDSGFEVVYEGIRLTPQQIVNAALEEGVHVIGLSILSGSHVALVQDTLAELRAQGLGDLPVVVGGIIPPEDAELLAEAGVAAVYTPKDYDLTAIMADILEIVDGSSREAA